MPEPAPSPFAPFANPSYRAYWLTGLVANFGWLIQLVGASWLMTQIGGSAQQVALVQTLIALPVMLFVMPAGAMADTFGRRRMVLGSQTFLLAVSTLLAVLAGFGQMTPGLLLGFTFLIGSGKALNNPGWQTLVNEFMPRAQMPQAVVLNSVGFNTARSLGPAIGGAIVATIGAFAAFVVAALSNIGMIVVLALWKQRPPPRSLPPESIGGAILSGLRYVAMSPNLIRLIGRAVLFNLTASSVMALLPLVARDLLEGGPGTYGLLLGAFGVGAILSAFMGAGLRDRMPLEWRLRTGFAAFALAAALVGVSSSTPLTLLALVLAGASWLQTQSTFSATVQMSSPRWVVSRCHSTYQAGSFGATALGSWVWGYVAGEFGLATALLASALGCVAAILPGLIHRIAELDLAGLDPRRADWTPPEAALDLLPRSGPILTEIEYVVREADVPEFLALMAERRRSRTRDGARRWGLSRDIERPECWTEHFLTATWIETLRHHERRTVGDLDLGARLRALHAGTERPRVRYHIDRQPRNSPFSGYGPEP